ncbi:MAG: hypothetical protein WBD75_08105 [Phycisphaerae bacterium]
MTVALVWGLIAVGVVLLAGFCFRVAAGMVHVEGATFGRAMLSALFSAIVAAAFAATVVMLTAETAAGPGLVFYTQWLAALLVMIVSIAILRNAFATSFPKAIAVWCAAVGLAVVLSILLAPLLPALSALLARYTLSAA